MNNIAICIPTYKRPFLLRQLVTTLLGCSFDSSVINKIFVVVVDNDAEKSALRTMIGLKEKETERISINYFSYPEKGLSNVRNELIRRALEFKPAYIVFIDDDEYVSEAWLNELVRTIVNNNGDMAMGPVISVFESGIPESVTCWFDRPGYPDNQKIDAIATNNLIIKVDTLLNFNVWFDPRFNITGAEDSYFGKQMLKKGAEVFWAARAVVYESIPESRANIHWLMRRYYNGANTYTYILRLEKEYFDLAKKILVSFFYILAGLFASLLIPLPLRRKFWGPLKISEGFGSLAGFLSIKYYEYK